METTKPKRIRTSKACIQCNKAKSKCELPSDGISNCHRCQRLGLVCEFTGGTRPPPQPPSQNSMCAIPENEGSVAARQLANMLGAPGVDSNLDCEKGIMRALTEYNYMSGDTPVELLREWTLVAIQRRDCGLLGRAMTLAAAGGHSMESLLGNVGTLSTMLVELTGLFQQAVTVAEHSSSSTSNPRTSSQILLQSPTICSVGSTDHPDLFLPECTSWIKESSGRGKQLILVKQVVDGRASFFTNRAFDTYVVSKSILQDSWAASGTPSIELFLHPDDAPNLCGLVGSLWKNLRTNPIIINNNQNHHNIDNSGESGGDSPSIDGITERSCIREMTRPVRMWVKGQVEGYVYCTGRVQLVVTIGPGGQSSNLIFSFQPAQSHLLASDRTPISVPTFPSYSNKQHGNSSSSSSSSSQIPELGKVPSYPPPKSQNQFGINPAIVSKPMISQQPGYSQENNNNGGGSGDDNVVESSSILPPPSRPSNPNFVRPSPPEVGDEILETSDFWESVAAMASEFPEDDTQLFLEV